MDQKIQKIIDEILVVEGRYVNDPADSGGETNWGITVKVAREFGYTGAMKDMPRQLAEDIYFHDYVTKPGFAKVMELSPKLAAELTEFGVNCGTGTAARCLQEGLNDLNNGASLWPELAEDGAIGQRSLDALRIFLHLRKAEGEMVLLRDINCRQHHHYSALVRRRPKDERFFYGWVLNRVVV